MKPTSRLHRGFVAATRGLTASLTLPVVFSGSILLAQAVPPQNMSIRDPFAPVAIAPQTDPQTVPSQNLSIRDPFGASVIPQPPSAPRPQSFTAPQQQAAPQQQPPTAPMPPITPMPPIAQSAVSSPEMRRQASQKLHAARKAVAVRDINTAERLLGEVHSMQLTYTANEDQPGLVQKLIQGHRHLAEQAKTQGNTEQFRREYARFHLIQADTMLLRGELDLALQLTQEAEKQGIQHYTQEDKDKGLEPIAMARKIDNARRIQNANAPAIAVQTQRQPLSQVAQAQLGEALQTLRKSREALQAGQFDQAEQLAKSVDAYKLPENAFPQGNTPSRLLTEIAARRQGMNVNPQQASVNPPVAANAQSAVYRPEQDQQQGVTQTATGNQPAMAPPVPTIPPTQTTPYIDQQIQNRNVIISRISSDVIQKLADAQRLTREQRKPDAALDLLHNLRRNIEQATQLDPATKVSCLQQIDRAIEDTRSFMQGYSTQEKQDRMNEAVWAELRHEQEKFRNKEEQLAAYFKEYKKLIDEERYEEALHIAKKTKEFAPDSPEAQVLATVSQMVYNNSRSRDIHELKRDGVLEAFMDVDRGSIIPDFSRSSMLYGTEWANTRNRRNASNLGLQKQRPEAERRIIRQLEMPITLSADRPLPLEQAMQLLCSQAGIPYILDRSALQEANVLTETMVVLPQTNAIKARSALNILLEQLDLGYVVKNEMLNITSKKRAKGEVYWDVYYVGDLLNYGSPTLNPNLVEEAFNRGLNEQSPYKTGIMQPRMPVQMQGAPALDGSPVSYNGMPGSVEGDPNVLAQYGGSMMGGGYGGGMGGMGGGYGGGMGGMGGMGGYGGGMGGMGGGYGGGMGGMGGMGGYGGGMGGMGGGMGMGFNDIYSIIQSVIEPESWEMMGIGGEGVMSTYPATQSLAIRQTEEVHAQIEDLLTQIRKMHDLQIAVEVRYITLSDQFYERIGTAFDMTFNNDNAMGRLTRTESPFIDADGTEQIASTTRGNNLVVGLSAPRLFTANAEVPLHQGSFDLTAPMYGGYNPTAGISTGFALLSRLETYFFVQAAQGDRRNSVMEAPKVMLHNGQPGMVNDTTQIPFVTSVQPIVADFALGYQPIITMLNQGQVLHVQATATNDRQHVRLTLNPTFTTLIKTETFKYFGDDEASEETTATRDGDDTASTSTDPRSASRRTSVARRGITIQQPIMATFSVSTTVSCPDGGTVLLGGIKRMSEGRVEAGVPILNKLPYIQRLFSNTSIGRDTQSVMMMVTPRIIIQEEEENFIMGNMP